MPTAPEQPESNDVDPEQVSTPAGIASDLEEEAAETGASAAGDDPER
jgi:hypothetical protein